MRADVSSSDDTCGARRVGGQGDETRDTREGKCTPRRMAEHVRGSLPGLLPGGCPPRSPGCPTRPDAGCAPDVCVSLPPVTRGGNDTQTRRGCRDGTLWAPDLSCYLCISGGNTSNAPWVDRPPKVSRTRLSMIAVHCDALFVHNAPRSCDRAGGEDAPRHGAGRATGRDGTRRRDGTRHEMDAEAGRARGVAAASGRWRGGERGGGLGEVGPGALPGGPGASG
jgi:hypothetical protein